ncbi:MAG: GIY-YIG nuclease family protein [Bacteroidales bacterium]|nr:GIY-YIG nuclease family protein [Bacteroidales bacterium]
MAILTISKLLKEAGLDLSKKIKLVRHKDGRNTQIVNGVQKNGNPYDWYLNDRETFIAYQSEQKNEVFKDVDFIVSFIGEEGTTARMIGVYKINGLTNIENSDHIFYNMEEVKEKFDELNERVIIDWGKSALSWHQWLEHNDKEVISIEKKGIDWVCPDYEDIILSYEQLKRIFENGISVWKNRLSSCNCIYVISDSKSEKLYVGSTYNTQGIWGRWIDYAKKGHGDNVELMKLCEKDSEYPKKYFQWSILQTLPLNIKQDKAVNIETKWKEKLGRVVCALNKN